VNKTKLHFCSIYHTFKTFKIHTTQKIDLTFKLIVFRVSWEKNIWEEFFKTISCILRSVFHVSSDCRL